MSLEKINPNKIFSKKIDSQLQYINRIKSEVLEKTGIDVSIKIKPPSTIVLTCGSASAASELNSQKDDLMILIKSINDSLTNLIIKI